MIGASIGLLVGAALADVGRGMEVRAPAERLWSSSLTLLCTVARSYAHHPTNVGGWSVRHYKVDACVASLAAVRFIRTLGLVRVKSNFLSSPSLIRFARNANMQNEFLDRSVDCSDRAVNCSGNDLLKFYDLYNTSYGLAIGILIAMLVVYRIIAYALLHLSAHRAKGRN